MCISAISVTYGQDPEVEIVETAPATDERGVLIAKRDEDVLMDCHVENLPKDTNVSPS